MVSMDDYDSAKGYIVIFTCNTCPYSTAYESRISDLHEKYASGGFPVLAVIPNDSEVSGAHSSEAMTERAAATGFEFPYSFVPGHIITKTYCPQLPPPVFLPNTN